MKDNYEYYNMFDVTPLEEARKERKRQKRKQKVEKAKEMLYKGVATLLIVGPPLIAVTKPAVTAVAGAVKSANKRANLQKEIQLKENRCYDRSLGHYWELERKLSNSDWLEINRRRNCGETLAEILADMKVLKK